MNLSVLNFGYEMDVDVVHALTLVLFRAASASQSTQK